MCASVSFSKMYSKYILRSSTAIGLHKRSKYQQPLEMCHSSIQTHTHIAQKFCVENLYQEMFFRFYTFLTPNETKRIQNKAETNAIGIE